jgi:glycosyltransferase involved in cell wall biosynthesis
LPAFSIVIPACNEAGYIGACLDALLDQTQGAGALHIIVAANACTDDTVAEAAVRSPAAQAAGHRLTVLDIAEGGKPNALNEGDKAAGPIDGPRAYLDADILADPDLFAQLRTALAVDQPRYATGRLVVQPARSAVTRAYGRFWKLLPFVQGGTVGAGFYAVNPAGRARWAAYPDIIADDSFARLQFIPQERVEVDAAYHWPLVEGLTALVKVRRRQNAGNAQLAAQYPQLLAREGKAPLSPGGLLARGLRAPVGFAVYATVAVLVRLRRGGAGFTRGR